MNISNDGLEVLSNAVVCKAADDYIRAKLMMEKSFDLLEELRDFFDGDGYDTFNATEISGEEIMRRCDKIVERKLELWRKRHKKELAAK